MNLRLKSPHYCLISFFPQASNLLDSVEDSLTSLFIWQQPEVSLVLLPFGPIWCSRPFVAKGWNYWHNCLISRYIVGWKSSQIGWTGGKFLPPYFSTYPPSIFMVHNCANFEGIFHWMDDYSSKDILRIVIKVQNVSCCSLVEWNVG